MTLRFASFRAARIRLLEHRRHVEAPSATIPRPCSCRRRISRCAPGCRSASRKSSSAGRQAISTGNCAQAAKGKDEIHPARRPALRQRQHPHRPRAQQDPQGRGDAQPADARLRLQLRAGLGLPRPADRMEDRGGELPLQEQEEAGPERSGGDDRVPPGMPRLCRALAQRAARGVQAARRRGRLGRIPIRR